MSKKLRVAKAEYYGAMEKAKSRRYCHSPPLNYQHDRYRLQIESEVSVAYKIAVIQLVTHIRLAELFPVINETDFACEFFES